LQGRLVLHRSAFAGAVAQGQQASIDLFEPLQRGWIGGCLRAQGAGLSLKRAYPQAVEHVSQVFDGRIGSAERVAHHLFGGPGGFMASKSALQRGPGLGAVVGKMAFEPGEDRAVGRGQLVQQLVIVGAEVFPPIGVGKQKPQGVICRAAERKG